MEALLHEKRDISHIHDLPRPQRIKGTPYRSSLASGTFKVRDEEAAMVDSNIVEIDGMLAEIVNYLNRHGAR
jgi:hypothetical protein